MLAEATARGKGRPDLRHVILPFPFETLPEEELRRLGRTIIAEVVSALVTSEVAGPRR